MAKCPIQEEKVGRGGNKERQRWRWRWRWRKIDISFVTDQGMFSAARATVERRDRSGRRKKAGCWGRRGGGRYSYINMTP
eukprot:749404-Hanusia_phi.AAC.2